MVTVYYNMLVYCFTYLERKAFTDTSQMTLKVSKCKLGQSELSKEARI
jgi:hypothetical protein